MLVLTRKLQEKICIGNDITVTILRVKGQQVRIGIEAPRDIRVIRGELPPMAKDREQPPAEIAAAEITGPTLFEIDATLVGADAECESADAEETSAAAMNAQESNTVLAGRGKPVAMKQFVRSVLESALAK